MTAAAITSSFARIPVTLPFQRTGVPYGAENTPVEPDPVRTGEGRKVTTETPHWGIEPVPNRLRLLGLVDTALLWTNHVVSRLVLALPAYFDLSLLKALLAPLVGALIGTAQLAVAGLSVA